MNDRFNSVEVIEMAKEIEMRGYELYTYQASETENQELVSLFGKLAQDELDHYKRFEELGESIKESTKNEAEYVYDPEVSAYLEAIVEFSVFPSEEGVRVNDIVDALQIAIYAEKDSILFYTEILQYNKGETAKLLKKLIKEEKDHLLDLLEYDEKIGSN